VASRPAPPSQSARRISTVGQAHQQRKEADQEQRDRQRKDGRDQKEKRIGGRDLGRGLFGQGLGDQRAPGGQLAVGIDDRDQQQKVQVKALPERLLGCARAAALVRDHAGACGAQHRPQARDKGRANGGQQHGQVERGRRDGQRIAPRKGHKAFCVAHQPGQLDAGQHAQGGADPDNEQGLDHPNAKELAPAQPAADHHRRLPLLPADGDRGDEGEKVEQEGHHRHAKDKKEHGEFGLALDGAVQRIKG
jgi:hypothetical protein